MTKNITELNEMSTFCLVICILQAGVGSLGRKCRKWLFISYLINSVNISVLERFEITEGKKSL